MAGTPEFFVVLRRVGISLNNGKFPSLRLKPLHVKCFESILKGHDVIGRRYWGLTNWIWQVDAISRLYRSRHDKEQLKLLL